MKVIDISWTISEKMTVYKDKPEKRPKIKSTQTFEKNGMNESKLTLESHTGTHVDAPKHFLKNGRSIDHVEPIVGKCQVLDLTQVEKISASDLKKVRLGIVLLKTRNSSAPRQLLES